MVGGQLQNHLVSRLQSTVMQPGQDALGLSQ
jgi:hypothetical protein